MFTKTGRLATALVIFLVFVAIGASGFMPIAGAQALSPEERARLQAEYDKLQTEIAEWQKVLDETRTKKSTLQGDVKSLDAQIKKAESEIKQRNIIITTIGAEIKQKTAHISALEEQIKRGKESLAKLLRQKNENDQRSIILLALSSQNFSEFFSETEAITTLNGELQQKFDELRSIRTATEAERAALDEKKNQELDAKYEVEVKKKTISSNQAEKKELLAVTASEEKTYSQVLAERQKRADVIRSALFELRDAEGIPFSSALEYANQAQTATGVRAAFILGILRQESNLGVNVGQCLLVDSATGAGKGKNTGTPFNNVMKPDRDVSPFLDLTSRLGKDPYSTPVSCPQGVGYGGAMGPSQFIASTWKIYEPRLAAALGGTPNPWVARDAIMATAFYLKDLKADRGTYSAEREAAGRYYAGAGWATRGLSYAASVLSFAEKYQEDIDFLKGI